MRHSPGRRILLWPDPNPWSTLSLGRPGEVFAQKAQCSLAVDGMRSVEKFDLGAVGEAKFEVAAVGAGVFVGDPFVGGDAVAVAAPVLRRSARPLQAATGEGLGEKTL